MKEAGGPVFAPFPGRLSRRASARDSPIGSVNFVLLRHDMSLGKTRVQFYSLYMHVRDEKGADAPAWMQSPAWTKNGKDGKVVLLDEPIDAGSIIAHVGKAGPGELSRAQIHVEIFSTAELFTELPGSPWTVVDGTAGGRFCDAPEITSVIDTDHDGMLSRQELASFYSSGGASALYYLITLHVSEWTADPPWGDALRVPKDFKKLPAAEIDQLVADQITPGLWWDAAVAAHCRLPIDGVVYHYHPISFLGWFNQQLLDAAAAAGDGKLDPSLAAAVPKGIIDDYNDVLGTSMRSSKDESGDPCNTKLTLEQLVEGFDTPECAP